MCCLLNNKIARQQNYKYNTTLLPEKAESFATPKNLIAYHGSSINTKLRTDV